MNIVEDNLGVRIGVPVHAKGNVIQDAARDALIVQVEVRETNGNLPRPGTTLMGAVGGPHPEEIFKRPHTVNGASEAIVRAVLAGQEPPDLHVLAVQKRTWIGFAVHLGGHCF